MKYQFFIWVFNLFKNMFRVDIVFYSFLISHQQEAMSQTYLKYRYLGDKENFC